MDEGAFEAVGREAELASLATWIADVGALPAAIVLEGEAGMGKTTLWRHGIELATQTYRILRASPSESEAELSFTALNDLLEPALDEVMTALPTPQRRGLAVALLREDVDGPPPDRHAIALAFLEAVRTLSRPGPLLIAVDDVQWLDEPSAFTLPSRSGGCGTNPLPSCVDGGAATDAHRSSWIARFRRIESGGSRLDR